MIHNWSKEMKELIITAAAILGVLIAFKFRGFFHKISSIGLAISILFVWTENKYIITGSFILLTVLRVGDTLPKKYLENNFKHVHGWGYYMKISDGWYAAFDFRAEPNKDSKILWFFRFDFFGK